MIYWNGQWLQVCSHHFRDNSVGVNAFCKKLGYVSGSFRRSRKKSGKNAFWIGKCRWDDKFPYCTGKCNTQTLGGICTESGRNCGAGEHNVAVVECNGPRGLSSSC